MTTNLPISRLINVAVSLTPQGAQFPNVSTLLVLGTSTVIDTVTRMRTYATLASVAADFGTSVEEYSAASAWFGQSPQPTSLNIGRWVNSASKGQLLCGSLSTANTLITAWNSITNATFNLAVDGGGASNVASATFVGQTTLAGIAGVIQTAIQGLGGSYAAVTCVYDSVRNRFVFTSGTTGTSSAVAFLTAGTGGTDISNQLAGRSTSTGAYVAPGLASETALAATTLFDNQFPGQWYGLHIPDAIDTDHVAVGSYIEGSTTNSPHFYFVNTNEVQVLATGDTTHIGYLLQQLLLTHTAWQYSSQSNFAIDSFAARILTTNWLGQNTAISLMYKQEPGITPETLNVTQVNALESYNGNVYVSYANGTAIIETGITPSGQFVDTVIGIDWLRGYLQTNVYNVLFTSPTKVPQTDAGVTSLLAACEASCNQGVINGLGAPGVWNSGGFGQLSSGQYLDKGYYVYAPPVATQTQASRQARQSPPIQIAFKLAGAIHDVSITVNVNQ